MTRAHRHHRHRRGLRVGHGPRRDPRRACARARSAIGPIEQLGHDRLAGAQSPPRCADSTRARWSTIASCTSSSAAPTSSASTPATARSTTPASSRTRDALRRRRRRALQRPHRRLRRLGRRRLREPVRLLPADDRGATATCARSARELGNAVNPMWLLRTLPNNVLCHVGIRNGLKGTQRLHHQSQLRRRAGGDRGGRGAAHRRGRPRGRDRARDADRAAERAVLPPAAGCSRRDALRPFDARARRQPVRRRRRRAGARDRVRCARARRDGASAKCWAAATSAEAAGLLPIRDDGDGVERAIRAALADARHRAGGRRHDRRARQRHAPVGCQRSRGAARACSAPTMPPVTAFKWAFGHLIAAAGILETVVALRRCAPASCRASPTLRTLDPACDGLARVGVGGQRRAATSRSSSAAASRAPTPRCSSARAAVTLPTLPAAGIALRHRQRRARAHRAPAARTRRPSRCARSSRRRSSPTAAKARAAHRAASPRASPPRRRASSSFRASWRWASSTPADFSVARDRYGAPQVVMRAQGARDLLARHRIAGIAVSLTHDRTQCVGGRAGVPLHADAPLAGRLLHALLPIRRRVILDNLRRVFGATRAGRGDRATRAGALRAPVAARSASSCASACCRAARKARARARREPRRVRTARSSAGKGVLILTGHFGNWEVATVAGIAQLSRDARTLPLRAPPHQAALARRAGYAPLRARGLRRDRQARLARRDRRAPRGGRHRRVPVRPVRRTARRHRRRVLRPAAWARSRASRSSRSPPVRR